MISEKETIEGFEWSIMNMVVALRSIIKQSKLWIEAFWFHMQGYSKHVLTTGVRTPFS